MTDERLMAPDYRYGGGERLTLEDITRVTITTPELLAAAKKALGFYDVLPGPHHEGEAAILDCLEAAIAKHSSLHSAP